MPPHLASAPNVNHLWAALLVEELARQGTTFFVVCPGSRSTPLAVAVAQNPRVEALVHWDERAAGFVALGWGRATGRPAAVVTTSGTAVANLLPAAVEADADGVPLLLLTADRPPELRETGANQTVRQPPIFQDVARWGLDAPVPTTAVPARWVLSTAAHAVERASTPPGPVHLNLPFREPLGAEPDGTDVEAYLAGLEAWLDAEEYRTTRYPRVVTDATRAHVASPLGRWDAFDEWAERVRALGDEARGVVVVGGGVEAEYGALESAVQVGQALRWPVLPDVLAGGGMGRNAEAPFVPESDLLLTSTQAREGLRPNVVLHLGGRPMSKRLSQLLDAAAPDLYLHYRIGGARVDPDARVTHVLTGGGARLMNGFAERAAPAAPPGWLQRWRAASGAAYRAAREGIDEGGLSEPYVARAVSRARGTGRPIVVGASMPIRDLEAYGDRSGRAGPVIANRGASGIDGTLATAVGVSHGIRASAPPPPPRLHVLLGDLALLHDQTSLALLRDLRVVVVCVNNDGGGIFHRLPIAGGEGGLEAPTFERFFGTPHGLTFEHAAAQVGIAYHAPATQSEFEVALEAARQSGASALIEVRTDRHEQAALRRRIEAACAEAVDAALGSFDA